jgi:iron complex transport system ATP-binding protein
MLSVQHLHLRVQGRSLVSDLSFEAQPGQRWAVIGRNAVGKTTLLRALAGLGAPRAGGQVQLAQRARVAYLPQTPQDRFAWTVQEYLTLHEAHAAPLGGGADAGLLFGAGAGATRDRLALLQDLDAAHLQARAVTQLSGGERQRVGLAAVAVQAADLWLLDEPVSAQDPAHQVRVGAWLKQQAHCAVLMSAHDMNWVQQVATHGIALMGDGRYCAGALSEVLTAANLHECFDCEWAAVNGRWFAGG